MRRRCAAQTAEDPASPDPIARSSSNVASGRPGKVSSRRARASAWVGARNPRIPITTRTSARIASAPIRLNSQSGPARPDAQTATAASTAVHAGQKACVMRSAHRPMRVSAMARAIGGCRSVKRLSPLACLCFKLGSFEPMGNHIARNHLVKGRARADHRVLIALHQHLRHQRTGVVFAGHHRTVSTR